jgi:hypothetical protein
MYMRDCRALTEGDIKRGMVEHLELLNIEGKFITVS